MRYRLYQPGDFAALYVIEETCFVPPLRFSRGYMRQLLGSPAAATWIAEEQEGMAGFAIVEWSAGEAYIQTLEVAPEQRRKGVGAGLLGCLEDSARSAGASLIWLHVDAANPTAIRLYEAHGYEYRGREENYYARRRAALVYAKPLQPAESAR